MFTTEDITCCVYYKRRNEKYRRWYFFCLSLSGVFKSDKSQDEHIYPSPSSSVSALYFWKIVPRHPQTWSSTSLIHASHDHFWEEMWPKCPPLNIRKCCLSCHSTTKWRLAKGVGLVIQLPSYCWRKTKYCSSVTFKIINNVVKILTKLCCKLCW